jgi:hypothetical protein
VDRVILSFDFIGTDKLVAVEEALTARGYTRVLRAPAPGQYCIAGVEPAPDWADTWYGVDVHERDAPDRGVREALAVAVGKPVA